MLYYKATAGCGLGWLWLSARDARGMVGPWGCCVADGRSRVTGM